MDFEILLNAGYTVLGGGLAAIFGFISQKRYVKMQREHDIEKIQDILKSEFEDLYRMLIKEQGINKNARQLNKKILPIQLEYEISLLSYAHKKVRDSFESRMWEVIISSGNLIKLNHKEIKIIQSVLQCVKQHKNNMVQLEKEINQMIKEQNLKINVVNVYLSRYEISVIETISGCKKLDNLPWFDYDQIKAATSSHGAE